MPTQKMVQERCAECGTEFQSCKGTGKTRNVHCTNCNGSGYVSKTGNIALLRSSVMLFQHAAKCYWNCHLRIANLTFHNPNCNYHHKTAQMVDWSQKWMFAAIMQPNLDLPPSCQVDSSSLWPFHFAKKRAELSLSMACFASS